MNTRDVKKVDKLVITSTEIVSNSISNIVGAAAGFLVAGPGGVAVGIAVTSIVEDITKKYLSPKEFSRIEKVIQIAEKRYDDHLRQGGVPRTDLDKKKYEELFEGTLLKARETYEEKKIPLLANLFAKAPFTNTPIENLLQTLIYAEQLSFRQLCILSCIDYALFRSSPLSTKSYLEIRDVHPDENTQGIFQDIFYMMQQGFIAQSNNGGRTHVSIDIPASIIPEYIILVYPGRLLYNSLELSSIEEAERKPIFDMLKL